VIDSVWSRRGEKVKKAHFPISLAYVLLALVLAGFPGCGKNGGGTVDPGADTSAEHWWDNFLDNSGNPITLSSGFKLVKANGALQTVTPGVSVSQGLALSFAVEPFWTSNQGYLFRGNNQNDANLENLAGAVEFIKQSGWLRHRETFDWEGLRENSSGSFDFTRVNRFTQLSIRSTFNGFATDLMLTLLSEPYIAFPTDTTRKWTGDPVYVSNGSGSEFVEVFGYGIHYIGRAELTANGNAIGAYNDVIMIEGKANEGDGYIQAFLAPNTGIIYYHLITAFGQEAAAALIGYSGSNKDISGATLVDYMPLSTGNQWIYEFAPDDHVPQFRFGVRPLASTF
jgi:hypothetical protein